MDIAEPHARRRGFFLHSDTGEPDTGEFENPEGFVVRVRVKRRVAAAKRPTAVARVPASRFSTGRSRTDTAPPAEPNQLEIRSGSVTGSRQRAHLPR
jgi:hypothetical protein